MTTDPLSSWRIERRTWLESLGDPLTTASFDEALLTRAKTMSAPERIAEMDRYRQIRKIEIATLELQLVEPRSIAENRWVLTLISADREEAVRSRASNGKAAKAAAAPATLDDLL